jgi:6-hydroxytryprostatin B O-methyltransferase
MAMLSSILHESSPNTVAHTATSALFITQPSYLDWATFMFDASVPTAGKLVEATEKWPESVKKNETAYNVAFGTEKPFFEHLKEEQERARVFGSYMRSVTDSEGTKLEHLVNGYDWASLGDATVVDVGLSTFHMSV